MKCMIISIIAGNINLYIYAKSYGPNWRKNETTEN